MKDSIDATLPTFVIEIEVFRNHDECFAPHHRGRVGELEPTPTLVVWCGMAPDQCGGRTDLLGNPGWKRLAQEEIAMTRSVNTAPREELIPEIVDTRRAAEILGRSPATLKRWRYEGIGPDYIAMQRRVHYNVAVLLEYIRQNTRTPSVRAAMEDTRGAL
jgi:hypothetical protein